MVIIALREREFYALCSAVAFFCAGNGFWTALVVKRELLKKQIEENEREN